jgi:hypothetical protein
LIVRNVINEDDAAARRIIWLSSELPPGKVHLAAQARLPVSKLPGRPRTHSLRDIFDAIFYVLRAAALAYVAQ